MILAGEAIGGPLELEADVCIVGAGSGGAVVAHRLSREGLSVIALEEGCDGGGADSELAARATRLRQRGWQATADRGVEVQQALLLGGSSRLGSNLARRAPAGVFGADPGVPSLDTEALAAAYERVEGRVPAGRPAGGDPTLEDAARSLGWTRQRLPGRDGDDAAAWLGSGPAPERSVRPTWIRWADEAGARLLCGCRVEKVRAEDAGFRVEAVSLERGVVRYPVTVTAGAVVLAAGAVQTPALALRSRLPDPHRRLGQGLRLQPTARVIGRFDDPVDPAGAPRLELEIPADEPIPDARLRTTALLPATLARTLPLRDEELAEAMTARRRLRAVEVVLRDRRSGRVVPMTGTYPVIRYELAPPDRRRLRRALVEAARLLLAAGARQVWTSHAVPTEVRTETDLPRIEDRHYRSADLGLASTTPLGTCALAARPQDGVTGEGGRFHGLEGLYVADASLLPAAPGVPTGHTVAALALGVADAVVSDRGSAGA